jgi:hypothetical protein
MSSESQISANRLNAQKSTGPRTPEGKEKVSQNAVTHGLTAFRPVLANENPEQYSLFRDDFFRHHAPVGILEESLAQRAADTFWRLQRAQNYETAVLDTLIQEAQNPQSDSDCHSRDLSAIASATAEGGNPDLWGQVLLDDFRQTHCLEKIQKYEMAIERSYYRTVKELRQLQSQRLRQTASDSSSLDSGLSSLDSKTKNKPNPVQSKPKIPTFDPIKLLENCITNPIGLDPLTKIMMKSDRDRRLAKKAM